MLGAIPTGFRGTESRRSSGTRNFRKFAAVESPFTYEYLHYLLRRHGFRGIVRHHNVNGMFPVSVEQTPLRDAVHGSAVSLNSITALKPEWAGQDTEDPSAPTSAAIDILQADVDRNRRQARLRVRLTNNGAASWLHRGTAPVSTVLTLFCREAGGIIAEAVPLRPAASRVVPGATCVIEAVFDISKGSEAAEWHVRPNQRGPLLVSRTRRNPGSAARGLTSRVFAGFFMCTSLIRNSLGDPFASNRKFQPHWPTKLASLSFQVFSCHLSSLGIVHQPCASL